MANEEKVALLIEALLSNESVKKFVDDARQAGEDAAKGLNEGSKGKSNPFKEQGAALGELKGQIGGMITQYVALGAAVSYVGDAFRKALQEQKTNTEVIGNMMALTDATEAQAEATIAWLDAAEMASGIDKDRLAPALNELAASTANLSQAQIGVNIAAGAASRGLGGFEGNARALAMALETGVIPKKTAFGKVLFGLKEKTGSLDGAIQELNKRYGDAGQAVNTNAMEMDRSKVKWDNAKEAVGGMVQNLVISLLPALKWVAMAIAGVVGTIKLVISYFKLLGETIGNVAGLMVNAMTGNWKDAWSVFKEQSTEAAESFMADFTAVGDQISQVEASFEKMSGKIGGGTATAPFKPQHGKGGKDDKEATTKVNLGSADLGNMSGESIVDKQLRQDEELLASKKLLVEYTAKSEEELNEKLLEILKEREALYEEGSDRQLEIGIERNKLQGQMDASAAAKKKKIDDGLNAALQSGSVKRLKELQKQYKDDLKDYKKTADEKKKIAKDLAKVEESLGKTKLKAARAIAGQSLELAKGVFGDSKEMAIAGALINMFDGITAVWAEWGEMPVVAAVLTALVSATVGAEIQNIKSTEPSTKGAGFDDPQNDLAAEIGGARWAKDFTKKFGARAMQGMSDEFGGMGGGSETNYNYHQYQPGQTNRTTNVNVGAVPLVDTGKDHMMRELASGIRTYIDLDSERDVK